MEKNPQIPLVVTLSYYPKPPDKISSKCIGVQTLNFLIVKMHHFPLPSFLNLLLLILSNSTTGWLTEFQERSSSRLHLCFQPSGMVLFEDALKTGTLVEDLWSNASVRTIPVVDLAPQVGSHPNLGAWCGVRKDLFQSNIGGPNGHAEFRATPEGQGH